jgi:preprotein translocase subunit SecE
MRYIVAKQVPLPTKAGARKRAPTVPSISQYIQESRAELRKVTWPTREETIQLTTAVIAMTLSVAIFLGIIDEILNKIIAPLVGAK